MKNYKFDENLTGYAKKLKKEVNKFTTEGISIKTINDQNMKGFSDFEVQKVVLKNKEILVTQDDDFLTNGFLNSNLKMILIKNFYLTGYDQIEFNKIFLYLQNVTIDDIFLVRFEKEEKDKIKIKFSRFY